MKESSENKIGTGINKLDELMSGGLPVGDMSIIVGQPKESFIRFLPVKNPDGHLVQMFNLEKNLESGMGEKAVCIIEGILDYLKENNIDTSKSVVTKHEKIGDTVFPVSYFPNSMVIVDYPNTLFCSTIKNKTKNDNSTGSTDK